MTFLDAHVALWLCLYLLLFLDCDIDKIKVLLGLGLVMFATFLDFFFILKLMKGYLWLRCWLVLMVACDIPSWLCCIMVKLFHELCRIMSFVVVSFKHSSRAMMDYIIHPFPFLFVNIVTFINGYAGMQCSWRFMLYCDIH